MNIAKAYKEDISEENDPKEDNLHFYRPETKTVTERAEGLTSY